MEHLKYFCENAESCNVKCEQGNHTYCNSNLDLQPGRDYFVRSSLETSRYFKKNTSPQRIDKTPLNISSEIGVLQAVFKS